MAPRLWNAAAAAASEEPPPTSSAHEYDFAAAEREGVEAAARARFAAEAPPEVLAGVLSWLAPHALASVACASRAFRDLARHDDVWRFACEGCRRWPGRPVHGSYRASVVVQTAVDANWSRHRFKRLVSRTHSSYIHAVALAPSRQVLFTGSADGCLRAARLATLHGGEDFLAAPPGGGASSGTAGAGGSGSGGGASGSTSPASSTRSDDLPMKAHAHTPEGCETPFCVADSNAGEVTSVTLASPSADCVLTSAGSTEIAVWSMSDDTLDNCLPPQKLDAHRGVPSSVLHALPEKNAVVSGLNSSLALTGSLPGVVSVLDLRSWSATELECGPVDVYALAGTSRIVAAACSDGLLRLWDTRAGGATLCSIRASRRGAVRACSSDPDVPRIAVGGADGSVRLYDTRMFDGEDTRHLYMNRPHDDVVNTVKYDRGVLLSGGDDGRVCAFQERTNRSHVLQTERVGILSLDHEHMRVVAGAEDANLRIYDFTLTSQDSTFNDAKSWEMVRHAVALRQATRGLTASYSARGRSTTSTL